VLPTVLSVTTSSQVSAQPISLDFGSLPNGELRLSADGWHAVLWSGGVTHRMWLKTLPVVGAAHAIELPMDSSFELRSQAAQSLWRAMSGRSPRPPLSEHSRRRQQMTLVLRALDGRNEGQTYRAIAEGLFGKKQIPERAWKTHDLRNRTIRLVKRGLALMRGGYRELLRARRKDK
jgi:Uncharacterized conserved protein (DUF2285)